MVKITRERLSTCDGEAVRVNGNRPIRSSQAPSAFIAYFLSTGGLPSILFQMKDVLRAELFLLLHERRSARSGSNQFSVSKVSSFSSSFWDLFDSK